MTNTLAAAQGAGGEVTKDEDQDMVCEDGHFVPLVGGLFLHLDEDLVEQGRRWKRQRCCLNQRRSNCGSTQMSEEGNKNPRTMHKGSAKALPLPLDLATLSSSDDGGDEY